MASFLRIYKPPAPAPLGGANTPPQDSPYYERLLKLIPAEIVTLYVSGTGAIPTTDSTTLWIWAAVCLALLIILRAKATQDPASGHPNPQWMMVIISSVSFIIWAYALGGIFTTLPFYKVYVASLLIMTWTVIVPVLYKGD